MRTSTDTLVRRTSHNLTPLTFTSTRSSESRTPSATSDAPPWRSRPRCKAGAPAVSRSTASPSEVARELAHFASSRDHFEPATARPPARPSDYLRSVSAHVYWVSEL